MTAVYEFVRPKSLPGNVRAIAISQLEEAQASLTTTRELEKGIYAARKNTKRLRALLQLVRTALPKKVFGQENAAYREIADALGGLRDAWVRVELMATLPEAIQQTSSYHDLYAAFRKEYDTLAATFLHRERFKAVTKQIRAALKRAQTLKVNDKDYETLRENLDKTIQAGQKAYQQVQHTFDEDNLHEWRKQIKRLWYHLTLLRPAAPDLLDEWIAELGQLGDGLGKAHDWALLAQLGHKRLGDDPVHQPLWDAMAARQREAEEGAMAAGEALYIRLRPRTLLRLLGARYHHWQTLH